MFVLGLIAKYLQKLTDDSDILKDLVHLSSTMSVYCRTDLDKSYVEDKHAFRLMDILNAANMAGLGTRYFPNYSFEDFAGLPSIFNYTTFVEHYLKYSMNFSEKTVTWFMNNTGDVLGYIMKTSGTERAPESLGVFVLTRPA